MCRFAIVLTCLLGFGMGLQAQPFIGSPAPNFTLNLSSGGSVTLSSMLGEVVYLNFFGATCPICIEDGWISEEIYQMFRSNSEFNIYGIDVWNLPAPYVNTSFRAASGITYPLLVTGRATGIAYNLETNPVPSPTDVEHRGHIIIDRQGIMRYYAIYDPLDTTQQTEMINLINSLLDPCYNAPLDPPSEVVMIQPDEGPTKLCWHSVPCASRYLIFKSVLGDWSDEMYIGESTELIYPIQELTEEFAIYRVVAEHQSP